ncbi:MAG TPA: hypothetical protein VE953_03095 [Terriglobales bacterium]|nr:hypothetical protein [Terriglobales bacterium]
MDETAWKQCGPGKLDGVWFLDASNSPELINRLRPHARRFTFETASVGEGWRTLVGACHERLVAKFPEYELFAVKQKYGYLAFQAFAGPRVDGKSWTTQERRLVHHITDEFRARSESICEWCGCAGALRSSRRLVLTLCDACHVAFADPPQEYPRG